MAANDGTSPGTARNMEKGNRILVIRLSAMGDVAMTVPVLSALVQTYPQLNITVLTRGFFRPIFKDIPNLTIYEVKVKGPHKGFFGLWKLFLELKALEFDAVADLHNVLRSNLLKFFFKILAIPFAQIDKGRAQKKALTADRGKVFAPLKTTHERYADVFSKLGFPISLRQVKLLPRLPLADTITAIAGHHARKWIGIAPFAAFNGKMYPQALMEEVIRPFALSGSYTLFLFGGGAKEQRQLESWERKWENCISIPGKLGFEEELVLISNLDLMVSMDSGNGHLSAMFNIPTITIWGVTHPYAGFTPFAQDPENSLLADRKRYPLIPTSVYGNKIPSGYEHVMETIPPKDVIKKIENVLSETLNSE